MAALFTIKQFCDLYQVSRATAYRLKGSGAVPHVHIGRAVRIRREDADKWYHSLGSAANG